MKTFISKWLPKDFIALVVLVFSFFLISQGINSIVSGIVISITAYYFAKRPFYDNPKNS